MAPRECEAVLREGALIPPLFEQHTLDDKANDVVVGVPLRHLGDGVLVLCPKAVDPRDGPDDKGG